LIAPFSPLSIIFAAITIVFAAAEASAIDAAAADAADTIAMLMPATATYFFAVPI